MKKVVFIAVLFATAVAYSQGWSRTYGGDEADWGSHIIECSDGNYAILGRTASFGEGSNDIWLLKIDTTGDTLWTRTYGGPESEWGSWIEETSDSGFIIGSETRSYGAGGTDIWLIKTNMNGDTIWTKTYGWDDNDECEYVAQMDSGGYLIIGEADNYNQPENGLWIMCTDSMGDTVSNWFSEGNGDNPHCANRGLFSYVVVGYIEDLFIEEGDIGVVELDIDGNVTAQYTFHDEGSPVGPWFIGDIEFVHGPYVMTGSAYGWQDDGPDLWLSSFLPWGSWLMTSIYSRGLLDPEDGNRLDIVNDNGYIITGTPWTLFRTDGGFDTMWTRIYDGGGHDVLVTEDSGFLVVGSKDNDLWLLKTDSLGDTLTGIEEQPPVTHTDWQITSSVGPQIVLQYSDSPQGFHASIFDATGRKVDELHSSQPSGVITWGECYGPGVYFVRTPSEIPTTTHKVILID